MVNSTSYQPPIDKLLTLGSQQLDYITELGLNSEHIPDLIKMAVDNDSLGASDDNIAWAPVHAWRILGQLQATEAITPLIQLFQKQDNDLVNEELPKVYGKIGTAAIPELTKYLNSHENELLARVTAINSLQEIAQQADARDEIIKVLTNSLLYNQNPSELNGFIINTLIDLQALEAAPVIKYVFNANQVSDDIVGSWDDVRESLGITDDVQEFQPQALEEVINTEIPETPDTEQSTEDEINALIDLVTEVTDIEIQTPENTLSTPELVTEVVETQTSTQEDAVPIVESTSENDNTDLLQDESEVQQEIIDREETFEASTNIDESDKQTENESIEVVTEEPNILGQEDNKGFGRLATSKEKPEKPHKAKPNKKKKRGFSDL
jgi:hypothetical protein